MYDSKGDLVNLQSIAGNGGKWFLRGGVATGCCFPLPREQTNYERVLLAEGFATAAALSEATPYSVGAAFSAGNLPIVAPRMRTLLHNFDDWWWQQEVQRAAQHGQVPAQRPPSSVPIAIRLVIAADDDYQTENNPGLLKGLAAARVGKALIAWPDFGDPRPEAADGMTDFDDMRRLSGDAAVKATVDAAYEARAFLEWLLLSDPHAAHGSAMVKELAAWRQLDPVFYERLLLKLKGKHVRIGELDRAVKAAGKAAALEAAASAGARTAPQQVDVKALARSAKALIDSKDVLADFTKAHSKLYVGEYKNAKLLYLVCTSRLGDLQETMHGAVKGPSAVGKSALLGSVTAFMPKESVFKFVSLSEKALFYLPDGGDLSHKILLMAEVPKDEKQQQLQNLLLRELMSEGVLHYPVVQKVGEQFETVTIEVKGPVAFLVSTTKTEVDPENETRLISLELNDSKEQTGRVMLQVARREGYTFTSSAPIEFAPWHDFQRWLATGERRVHINYAIDLAKLIPAKAVRQRRDMGQLLRAIKAHALIHRQHRLRAKQTGAILATIADYKAVRELMADAMSESAEIKARKTLRETVAAVRSAQTARGSATVNEIADELDIDRSATKRRLDHALRSGFVALLEERHGRAFLYATTGATIGEDAALLPTAEMVEQAYRERRAREAANLSPRNPPDSPAQLHSSRSRR
jgi:hypothetical protein